MSNKKKARRGGLTVSILSLSLLTVMAGAFSNIYCVLTARALVGVGVGIIMPMSTGLLAFYYTRDKQDRLMGYSSAMNQLGGSIATLLSGLLAVISWRASFLVYLMGGISIVLCSIFMPNERIGGDGRKKTGEREKSVFAEYYPFIVAMFLLMFTFFIYPASFAMETAKAGIIPQHLIAVIMAIMDACGFLGGLAFAPMKRFLKNRTKFAAPVCFIAGYGCLLVSGNLVMTLTGSVFIGFAAGAGVPFLISTASMKAGRNAGSTVLPLISAALYTAQFLTPMILSVIEKMIPVAHISYLTAIVSGTAFLLWSVTIREGSHKERVIQESV